MFARRTDARYDCLVQGGPPRPERPEPSRSVAIASSVDAATGIVTLTFTGVSSYDHWERAVATVLADPAYHVGMCFVSDRRMATDIMTKDYIGRVVDYLSRSGGKFLGCGWALVADDPADFGMTRMGAIFAERTPVEVRAFQSMDGALEWLRVRMSPPPHGPA